MEERGVDALERAFKILDCFDQSEEPLSLAELARRSTFYKSTILRITVSMVRYGYLVRQPDGRFRLGPTLLQLGSRYAAQFDYGDLVRAELRTLVDATSETASYFIREGNARVCLYRVNSRQAIRHHLDEGRSLSLKKGATAKIFRAYCEDLDGDPAVRTAGYALSLGEREPEVAAVAVPVLDQNGTIRGAMSVSGLMARFDENKRGVAVKLLKKSAARLSSTFAVT